MQRRMTTFDLLQQLYKPAEVRLNNFEFQGSIEADQSNGDLYTVERRHMIKFQKYRVQCLEYNTLAGACGSHSSCTAVAATAIYIILLLTSARICDINF